MATYNPTFFYSLLTFLHFWIKNSLDCNIFLFPLRSKEAKHDRMKEQQNYWKITDNHKSVNLQYNTLGCLDDGTNELSTKRLMFQELFFFMISRKILCKNPFIFFSYFSIKIKSCALSLKNHKKNNAWDVRLLVKDLFVPSSSNPA